MSAHNRKLKVITFELDGAEFQVQISNWNLENNSADPETTYTYAPDGEFNEDVDPDYSLTLTFFADWRSAGISHYLWSNDGATVEFTLDHHPDIPAEHVQWTGEVKIKAPNVGGEVRTTEVTETTLKCIGKPDYDRVGA